MDRWLKALVSAACVVVIAAGLIAAYNWTSAFLMEREAADLQERSAAILTCDRILTVARGRKNLGFLPNLQGEFPANLPDSDLVDHLRACAKQVPEFAADIEKLLSS